MADWYVYQHDGKALGPWSTETVAGAILGGTLASDVWVAAPGGPRWLRALDVPVIGRLVEGSTTRRRRDSGLHFIPGTVAVEGSTHESTMMIVDDAELEITSRATPSAPRVRSVAPSAIAEPPATTLRVPVYADAAERARVADALPTERVLSPDSR